MRRLLIRLLAGAVLLGVALGLGGWYVFTHPEILINPSTLRLMTNQLEKKGVHLQWKDLVITAKRKGKHQRQLSIRLRDACLRMNAPDAPKGEACFKQIRFDTLLGLKRLRSRVLRVGPVELLGGNVVAVLESSDKKSPSASTAPPVMPGFLQETEVSDVTLAIERYQVGSGSEVYSGDLYLQEKDGRLVVSGSLASAKHQSLSLSGTIQLPENPFETASPKWKLIHAFQGTFKAPGKQSGKQVGRTPGVQVTFKEHGILTANRVTSTLDADLLGISSNFKGLSLASCEVISRPRSLKVNCPVAVVGQSFLPAVIPLQRLEFNLKGEATFRSRIPDLSERLQGKLAIEIPSLGTQGATTQAVLQALFNGVPNEFPDSWKADAELSVDAQARSVRKLFARNDLWTRNVPAPLSVLDGAVTLSAKATGSFSGAQGAAELSARLRSERQRFVIGARGEGGVAVNERGRISDKISGKKSGVSVHLELTDVMLELPGLDPLQLPQLLPDTRILRQASKTAPSQALPYQLTLKSATRRPIYLTTRLSKKPIPLQVALKFRSTEPLAGTVGIRAFELEAFRRKARIEHLSLTLQSPFESSEIEGVIQVPFTDYTFKVAIYGTVARPQVRLSSSPPLPEEKIVAALLFGVPFEELDEEQESSVAHTRAAITDGVMGLASLYVLASTPVERIGYDPTTQTVSVRVRIAEGTSFTYRSNAEEREFGLRKRLGPRWWVITDLTQVAARTSADLAASRSSSGASTFIEWHLRY